MNRINNKTLIFIIGVLLISNIFLLSLYLTQDIDGKKTGKNRSPVEYMTSELQLNDVQSGTFAQLWKENKERNKPIYDSIRSGKEKLYQYLKTIPQPDSLIEPIAGNIAQFEKELTLNNFAHFRKLSELCTPEQQVKLDSLLKRIRNKRAGRMK